MHRPAPVRTFALPKKWGPQRKDFGGRYGFPGFHRVFVSTTGLESFSLGPEKFSKRFSFGGGTVLFSSLLALEQATQTCTLPIFGEIRDPDSLAANYDRKPRAASQCACYSSYRGSSGPPVLKRFVEAFWWSL